MKIKVYSGLNSLPRGKAPDGYTEGCLALEGGAFRGVYTSGVLDLLMEKGINFTTVVGISAGALNGMNYVSGDIGRSALCNLKHRHDSRWVGAKAVLHNHGVMGYDFLLDGLEKEYPLDRARCSEPAHHLVAVATNLKTGQPEYFDSRDLDFDTMFQAVRASSSMPFVSEPVPIGDNLYLDGGCSTKLPVSWALQRNFGKIVFVASRQSSYRRDENKKESRLLRTVYHNYPDFRHSVLGTAALYNRDCDMIDRLAASGRLFRIAPSEKVTVSRLEGDMEKLGQLYWLGYHDAQAQLEALKEYLEK